MDGRCEKLLAVLGANLWIEAGSGVSRRERRADQADSNAVRGPNSTVAEL